MNQRRKTIEIEEMKGEMQEKRADTNAPRVYTYKEKRSDPISKTKRECVCTNSNKKNFVQFRLIDQDISFEAGVSLQHIIVAIK